MIKTLRKITLSTRLVAIVISISIIPLILLTFISYDVFRTSIQNKLIQATCTSAQLASNNINLFLNNYHHYIDLLSVSDAVQSLERIQSSEELSERYNTTYQLNKLIQNTPIPNSGLMGVMIVDSYKNSVFGTGYAAAGTQEIRTLLECCDNSSPLDCIDRFVNPNFNIDFIAVARKIYSSRFSGTHIGYIVVLLSSESLYTSAFTSPWLNDDAGFLLISFSGQVMASNDPKNFSLNSIEPDLLSRLMDESFSSANYTSSTVANSYLYICNYNQDNDSYILSVIPYSFISNEQHRVFSTMILFLIPLIILCLLLCYLLDLSINIPIGKIIESCNTDINSSNYRPIGDSSPDELGFLARTLDTKNRNIIALIADIRKSDARKRDLELEVLHYQINPHFLFNTLGTFKWMAELSNNTILGDGIGSLISLLRSTLAKNQEFVTLQNEIENLKHYNRIQNLRYISRFNTQYNIEETAYRCLIPHFILQPLLENAILYAASDADRIINITVSATLQQDILTITIADDGIGFDVKAHYDSDSNRFTGVGLQNVNERLKLYYGEDNGLNIYSQSGVGTTCILHIPATLETNESEKP